MSLKSLEKVELKLVAEELALDVPSGAKIDELKSLVESSEVFENDAENIIIGESFELSTDVILKRGRFNLRKLRSNSRELEKLWMDNVLINVDVVSEHQLKTLGLNWNPDKDELSLEMRGSSRFLEIITKQ
ncbi:uncharacterized protein NPIL_43781 [Nephila pilipes]|uniref:Uncharacterized protein n=1 Tax=Nephila pilipes TaxID=299642 RepID=A0A8X6NYY3_NEPPI|nr:uncharacterized protein NPIL_43781 [Nephila pilipes]